MKVEVLEKIDSVGVREWNALAPDGYPFLQHAFLAALERHNCVGEAFGWLPKHVTLRNDDGLLVGACPVYLKFNSWGEFVFDWSWADAYERAGGRYYPKLVCAVPYTPAPGPRLLVHPREDPVTVRRRLIEATIALAQQQQVSSVHWLFPRPEEHDSFDTNGLLERHDVQFHWCNQGYQTFGGFLGDLTAKRRKRILRERRQVREAGVKVRVVQGSDATAQDCRNMHRFYAATFDRKSGYPVLNLDFFQEIAQTMGDRMVLMLADLGGECVAGALSLRSDTTLYGRHWGCVRRIDSLHFEVCYYQGLEYCIDHGLQVFQPGAQGQHKIWRGFLPVRTRSAHWIADPGFRDAIAGHLEHEREMMAAHILELASHSPYHNQNP